MPACFVLFRPGTILILRGRRAHGCRTGIIAVLRSVFFKKLFFAVRRWLEAMLPRLRSGSNIGMLSQVSRWPNVGKGFVHV